MEEGARTMDGGEKLSSLAEQWPYLRFLGLGTWRAWIWLCYSSVEMVRWFPETDQLTATLWMYLFSTLAIGCSMLLSAVFWRKTTRLTDNRMVVIGFGLFAALATVLVGYSPYFGNEPLFAVFAVCTGLGTSFLCLKVGRVYGTVSLGDSLTAGGISLLLAVLLYFVGIGIPVEGRIAYIAVLPLISALLLVLKSRGQLEGFDVVEGDKGVHIKSGSLRSYTLERKLLVRLTAAAALVALIAGFGNGFSSTISTKESFSLLGIEVAFAVGILAVLIIVAINKQSIRRGVYQIYSGLMVLGVAMLLATTFGFDIGFFAIPKEALWLVLSCFMAYIAFKFDLSPIWVFSIGQAAYFMSSTAGWVLGSVLSPYYLYEPVHGVISIALAFMLILVLVYVFNGKDLSRITSLSVQVREKEEICGSGTSPSRDIVALGGGKSLSEREFEVMELFAAGRSANWIADAMTVSESTVRSHIRSIYTKLGVHSRQELLDILENTVD